ncbi:hypothetical protein ACFV2N_22075 [Streptomyces sp. NPDC059680]|uniref:hypothetical protein n=1 Tax=Streptomyces sp. NPDC059680 TaxID=3346904 RepID=UPI0036D1F287
MFGKKSQHSPDLTTPENFKKGQKVYDRIVSGECKDVTAELNDAYGRSSRNKRG